MDMKLYALLNKKLKGKADLVGGKIPASQLPSYVDDVVEYNTLSDFPEIGEESKIYVALDTNNTYRWSGSQYTIIGSPDAIVPVDDDSDIPDNELGLYRFTEEVEGVAQSSHIHEVVKEDHGAEETEFNKVTETNNTSLTTTTFMSQFDNTLSNFISCDNIDKGYALHYKVIEGGDLDEPLSGIRIGTGSGTGTLELTLSEPGSITFRRYFGYNGSTGAIISYDSSAQVNVDGTNYDFEDDDIPLTINLAAGTHTISNTDGRIILVSFEFEAQPYSVYKKKKLARTEEVEAVETKFEEYKAATSNRLSTDERNIQSNADNIVLTNDKIGPVQIYQVYNNLPPAGEQFLNRLYRFKNVLYQCVQSGDGENKEWTYNVSGTSEITTNNYSAFENELGLGYKNYLTSMQDNDLLASKLYRNNGSIKLGSSSATGDIAINNLIADEKHITSLKIGVKAYGTSKPSAVYIEDLDGNTITRLIEDNVQETIIEIPYAGTNNLDHLYIESEESYTDTSGEEPVTIQCDKRLIITRIIADFGVVEYEWKEITNSITEITYADLKALRDNSKLIPGKQYRIIDFVTTVDQPECRSAGHPFDIIVVADSVNQLNENARAAVHYGDEYFGKIEQKLIRATLREGTTINDIETLYKVSIDGDQYSEPVERERVFTSIGTIVKDGIEVPYLFEPDPDDGGTDRYYVYYGKFEYDGTTYDMWQEYNYIEGVYYDYFELTNVVVDTEISIKYVEKSILSSWKIWYSLDNDKNRFAWADGINGKGVIYRMIDEFNNDLPYDFKNVQFKRYKVTVDGASVLNFDGKYFGCKDENGTYHLPEGYIVEDDEDYIWCYTFSNEYAEGKDKKDTSSSKYVFKNIIGTYVLAAYVKYLNNIVFFGTNFNSNTIGNNFRGNTIGEYFHGNTIATNFYYNMIGNNFEENSIGSNFYSNTIGNYFSHNTIGNSFYGNTIDDNFSSNTIIFGFYGNSIGNSFYANTIGNYFRHNTIGNSFYGNTIDDHFEENSIGNSFYANTIGDYFYGNSIGHSFGSNSIGNNFSSNTIIFGFYSNIIGNEFDFNMVGTSFKSNTIGRNCCYNEFDDLVKCCKIDDEVEYIEVEGSSSESSGNYIQNVEVKSGVKGSSELNKRTITVDRNLPYTTTFKMTGSTEVLLS